MLKIKNRRYEADDCYAIDKIKECEHDYDESGCFEEYASLGIVLNAQRAEADEREHGQSAESEGEHRESAFQEVSG